MKINLFICRVTENYLKVIKCLRMGNSKAQFVGLEVEPIAADIDTKKLGETLSQMLKKLEYNNHPLIISLPRQYATCRFLKVPSSIPQEIERIISLQAPRYLPYTSDELISAYQTILSDKEGFSEINLVLVHKDIIARYINILKELKIKNFKITLSSYGLANLYSYLEPKVTQPVMLIDIDFPQGELVINSGDKLLFSRSFKLIAEGSDWQRILREEINKTRDAYLKEAQKQAPSQIIIFGSTKNVQNLENISALAYEKKIPATEDFISRILSADVSFASLIGLALKDIPQELELLPPELKAITKKQSRQKEILRLSLGILGIVLMLVLGIAKNMDNKAGYLKKLKLELGKIENEARPLEEIEKRLEFIDRHLQKKSSGLDILYEISRSMPQHLSLTNFSYEQDKEVVLRGQSRDLNSVFAFVPQLEKSAAFKDFSIKVRYATQKKIPSGEIVDFEIVCSKK